MRGTSVVLFALLAASACERQPTGPALVRDHGSPAFTYHDGDNGPPPSESFPNDTHDTGKFTGVGTGAPVGLTCEPFAAGHWCTGFLPSVKVDGTLLDVNVQIPDGDGPHPLIVQSHGWGGSKNTSHDIADMLVGDGYAVLRYSARGFGDSWGQANFGEIHVELKDLQAIVGGVVDELADRPGLALNPDAVAVTGGSYGGAHSWLAALQPTFESPNGVPVRIRTIVPIAFGSDLLYSLFPNGDPRRSVDRIGGLKLSYVNGLYYYGLREDNPSRPYPNYPTYLAAWHAYVNGPEPTPGDALYKQVADGLAGYRSVWWQQSFWATVAANPIPIFQIQGFTDDLFPLEEAKRMLLALTTVTPGYPIATYLGDLGHPRASNKPGEVQYVMGLARKWFAFYLKGEGTQPPFVIYAAITRPRDEPFDPANVLTVGSYAELGPLSVREAFDTGAILVNPASDPLSGFYWDPFVMEAANELKPYSLPPPPSAVVDNSLAVYEVPVAKLGRGSPLLIAGQPTVTFRASTTAPRVQLNVRLFQVGPDETKSLVTRGTYTLDSGALHLPVGDVDVTIRTYGNLWRAPVNHSLRLEVTNVDSPYISPSKVPSVTQISNVRLEIPVR